MASGRQITWLETDSAPEASIKAARVVMMKNNVPIH